MTFDLAKVMRVSPSEFALKSLKPPRRAPSEGVGMMKQQLLYSSEDPSLSSLTGLLGCQEEPFGSVIYKNPPCPPHSQVAPVVVTTITLYLSLRRSVNPSARVLAVLHLNVIC